MAVKTRVSESSDSAHDADSMESGRDSGHSGLRKPALTVLSLIHYPIFGGPHNRNLRLSPLLRDHGIKLIVAVPNEPGNAVARLRAANVELLTLKLHRLRETINLRRQVEFLLSLPFEVRRLAQIIRDQSVDLVQINGLVNPHGALAARRVGVPVVWQLLDIRTPPIARRLLMPLVNATADVVMTDGPTVARLHSGTEQLGTRLIHFFPPVDTEEFCPDADRRIAARLELGAVADQPLVGTVANLNPQKGHELLLKAAARLRREDVKLQCRILGASTPTHAKYRLKLFEMARVFGLEDCVRFIDPADRVSQLLPGFDLFVRTSVPRSEGTSTSILEAMSTGLPVISTDVGGVSDVVEHEVTGLLVAPLDEVALADAILRLIQDDQVRYEMSVAGRQRALASFDQRLCLDAHLRAYDTAINRQRVRQAARGQASVDGVAASRSVSASVLEVSFACPVCRGPMARLDGYRCVASSCGRSYPVIDGIPVFLEDPSVAEHDELHHHCNAHKCSQSRYYDTEASSDFEVSRPHGTPRVHRWLLGEKFLRSVQGIEGMIPDATVLVVCGGSGMDAEFLERAGGQVTMCDISLGAVRRARTRAGRFGLSMDTLVADVERLPFEDASFDIVYVHDGLHHLADPYVGLAEMARVARRAVSITEPADAALTRAAIRFGLALKYEEAGNRVARLVPDQIAAFLSRCGLRVLASRRYAMYYRHEPGRLSEALSRSVPFWLAVHTWRMGNAFLGSAGNKLSCVAIREESPAP